MSRVCVFLAAGFEEIEALTVVDILRRAGIQTDMVSVTGEKEVTGAHAIPVRTDFLIEELDFSKVDMIVLPGGCPGTGNLEACELLMEQVENFERMGKYISAICAAPRILGKRGFLNGKKACCYPEDEKYLDGASVTANSVEAAGNILTSRGMGCAIDFSLAIVSRIAGQEAAEALAKKIIYNRG